MATSFCSGSDGGCMACRETAPIRDLVKLFSGVQGYGMSSPNCCGCCLDSEKKISEMLACVAEVIEQGCNAEIGQIWFL